MTEPTTPNDVKIRGEFTPDPEVCRFNLQGLELLDHEGTYVFSSPEDAGNSPLIAGLFAVDGVGRVQVDRSGLTLTKSVSDPWPRVAARLVPVLKDLLTQHDAPLLDPAVLKAQEAAGLGPDAEGIITELLEQHINPMLASHGGWVRLLKIVGNDVHVEMGGGCQGCAASRQTMKYGIERAIRGALPQVRDVVDSTDHSAGSKPYYT